MEQHLGIAINELHEKAMSLADEAFYAKQRQDSALAQSKYLEAFEYEKAAAMLLIHEYGQEPSRSVLFRSAACLLLNLPHPEAGHLRRAEQMVAYGLSGNPPASILEELREVWQELNASFAVQTAG